MRKMAVALLMVLNFGSVLWAAGTEPTGSPRQVSTREHLLWICTNSSSWGDDFIQTADIVFTQEDFENGGAFYNVGAGFSPIGNNGTKFTGSYDGQEFSIEGLLINRTSDYIGLFGWISDATIQNLSVTSVDISGGTFVGGLVGVNTVSATISNCSTSGRVTGTGDYVGGLIGYSIATIENSSSVCQVNGNTNIGGLVGNNVLTVSRCYSSGEVTGNQHVGGLVGYNTSLVNNSYSTGSVNGNSYTGDLVGRNDATVSDCYSIGNVTRVSGTEMSIGCFCGGNLSGEIRNCYSTGSVSYNSAENPTDKGFVGEQAGSGNSYANNFFDSTASNQSSDAVGSATPKTTVEMKNVRTFTDVEWSLGLSFAWDFETNPYDDEANNNYWDLDLDGIINNGYPYLSWEDGADVSLPVVLVNFTADQSRDGVVLRWTTESEIENLGFIICRKCKVSPTGVPEGKSSKWEEIASYLMDAALQGQGSTAERHDYQYIDFAVQPGMTYEYRLGDVDFGGKVTWCAGAEIRIKVGDAPVATEFGLQKAFPNPFNANVTFCYNLSDNGKTNLAVYNLRGQLVATLVNADKTKGTYQVNWQPRQLSTGIYIVRLESGARTMYRKIEYVK